MLRDMKNIIILNHTILIILLLSTRFSFYHFLAISLLGVFIPTFLYMRRNNNKSKGRVNGR